MNRFLVAGALAGAFATGCGVEQLPAAAAPAQVIPLDLDVPTDAPAPGTGRVILDTDGEPARVVVITGAAMDTSGEHSATVVGVRPLCTTPCVVDLPYGSHPLVMHSLSDSSRQSETQIEVGARAKVFRHTLGERTDGGAPRTVGSSLMTLGILAVATGAIMWAAGSAETEGGSLASNGQLVTGLGAAGVLLSVPFLIAGRPTERPGSTTQWTLPTSTPLPTPKGAPTAAPHAPEGAAVDRL